MTIYLRQILTKLLPQGFNHHIPLLIWHNNQPMALASLNFLFFSLGGMVKVFPRGFSCSHFGIDLLDPYRLLCLLAGSTITVFDRTQCSAWCWLDGEFGFSIDGVNLWSYTWGLFLLVVRDFLIQHFLQINHLNW